MTQLFIIINNILSSVYPLISTEDYDGDDMDHVMSDVKENVEIYL